jgi:hypothetical protein
VESDPIGLFGGLSTYGYAKSNSLTNFDLLGLETGAVTLANPIILHFDPPTCGDFCNCLANCIRVNDPLGEAETFGLSVAGGTVPKKLMGLPRGLGGASPLTTLPSMAVHYAQKCVKVPKYIVRGGRALGRAVSPLFIGYGLGMATVEIGCALACSGDTDLY